MNKTYISSDLHFWHKNILKYCPESRGQFSNADEMNAKIIDNFNSKIDDEDTLFIVGDIGFGKPSVIMECLKALNGKKIIVWGNHDFRLMKSHEFHSQRNLAGVIHDGMAWWGHHMLDDVKYPLHIQHFPCLDWIDMNHGGIMLHGHRHSPKGKTDTYDHNTRSMDIGADGNDLMPYDMDDVVRMMRGRNHRYQGHHDEHTNR